MALRFSILDKWAAIFVRYSIVQFSYDAVFL